MKKILIIVLILAFSFSVVACNNSNEQSDNTNPQGNEDINLKEVEFSDLVIPQDFRLINDLSTISSKKESKFYEYDITDKNLNEVYSWLNIEITKYHIKITNEFKQGQHFQMNLEMPTESAAARKLFVSTHVYGDKHTITFLEENYTTFEEIDSIHVGEMLLLFLPLKDGDRKKIILNDYFHNHSDGYFLAHYVLKAYNDELNKLEQSVNTEINGDDTLNFNIEIVDEPVRSWKITFPNDILPTDVMDREAYLSNLAHSILVGFKNNIGEPPFKNVIFVEGNKTIREYSLDNFYTFEGQLSLMKMPKDAIKLYEYEAEKANQEKKDKLFVQLLTWLEKNASNSIVAYYNVLQVEDYVGKEFKDRETLADFNNNLEKYMMDIKNNEFKQVVQQMIDNGLTFAYAEGDMWPVLDYHFLLNHFKARVSTDIKEYLELKASGLNIINEGYITIPMDRYGDRLVKMEAFMDKYPNSIVYSNVEDMYNNSLYLFLSNGLVGKSSQLREKITNDYQDFINKHQETATGTIVNNFLTLLKENDYKSSNSIKTFLQDYLPKN